MFREIISKKHRIFIWTIVIILVVGGGLLTYVYITGVDLESVPVVNSFISKKGTIVVNSDPVGAKIFLDDEDTDKTTIDTLKVKEGKYTIKLTKDGYKDYIKKVEVKKGEEVEIFAILEEGEGTTVEIPSDFTSIELNGVTVYYPSSYGEPEVGTSEEDFNLSEAPGISFTGEYATFNNYDNFFKVINMESYMKFPSLSSDLSLIKKVYSEKQVIPEDIYALDNSGYIPPANVACISYNPEYIESSDGSWRGYWYLAIFTQHTVIPPAEFVAVMYNKDKNKVLTMSVKLESKEADSVKQDIVSSSPNVNLEEAKKKTDNYMQTAYAEDSEIKNAVDNICLKICELVR